MVEPPDACAGGTLGFGPLGTQSPSYSRDDLVCVQKEMGVVLVVGSSGGGGGGGGGGKKRRNSKPESARPRRLVAAGLGYYRDDGRSSSRRCPSHCAQ